MLDPSPLLRRSSERSYLHRRIRRSVRQHALIHGADWEEVVRVRPRPRAWRQTENGGACARAPLPARRCSNLAALRRRSRRRSLVAEIFGSDGATRRLSSTNAILLPPRAGHRRDQKLQYRYGHIPLFDPTRPGEQTDLAETQPELLRECKAPRKFAAKNNDSFRTMGEQARRAGHAGVARGVGQAEEVEAVSRVQREEFTGDERRITIRPFVAIMGKNRQAPRPQGSLVRITGLDQILIPNSWRSGSWRVVQHRYTCDETRGGG